MDSASKAPYWASDDDLRKDALSWVKENNPGEHRRMVVAGTLGVYLDSKVHSFWEYVDSAVSRGVWERQALLWGHRVVICEAEED